VISKLIKYKLLQTRHLNMNKKAPNQKTAHIEVEFNPADNTRYAERSVTLKITGESPTPDNTIEGIAFYQGDGSASISTSVSPEILDNTESYSEETTRKRAALYRELGTLAQKNGIDKIELILGVNTSELEVIRDVFGDKNLTYVDTGHEIAVPATYEEVEQSLKRAQEIEAAHPDTYYPPLGVEVDLSHYN
jgi:hypothetical protein